MGIFWGVSLWGQPYDLVYGRLFFRVSPPDSFLSALTEWHFQGAYGDTLVWELNGALRITALEASFPVREYTHDTIQGKVFIYAGDSLRGRLHWVRVRYEGIPRSSGFGSFQVAPHATGWAVWTLSQPYGAPDWLFCQQGLRDKVDSVDICVITPDTLLGIANGRLTIDTVDEAGWRWQHFRHRHPIAVYLIAFAASNYLIQEYLVETPFHRFILRNYVYPQDSARAHELTMRFLPYFSWLENRIGPYPFADEDYHQVQIGWGGGMEHQTITFFGTYSLELWAHELAHQWFGDWVTCGSWQDIWLNEAFATYLGGAVYEALAPELWHKWLKIQITSAWRDTVSTIFVEDTTDIRRIFHYPTTYAKGAVALHALRQYVGDSIFWEGLRRFLRLHQNGFARTSSFQAAVAPVWGSTVTAAFITNWIFRPHYPQAAFLWENEGQCIVFPQAPYPMRIPVRFYLDDRSAVERILDFLLGRQTWTVPDNALRWEADPDTLYPYWGLRQGFIPQSRLLVSPNPFSDRLSIQLRGLRRLRLYDSQGRLLANHESLSPDAIIEWSLPFLSPGLYYLQGEASDKTLTVPVLRLSP